MIGSYLVEGSAWRSALGDDAALVRSLGAIPLFRRRRRRRLARGLDRAPRPPWRTVRRESTGAS